MISSGMNDKPGTRGSSAGALSAGAGKVTERKYLIVVPPGDDSTPEKLYFATKDWYKVTKEAIGDIIQESPSSDSIWADENGMTNGGRFNFKATAFWATQDRFGCVRAGQVILGTAVIGSNRGASRAAREFFFGKDA